MDVPPLRFGRLKHNRNISPCGTIGKKRGMSGTTGRTTPLIRPDALGGFAGGRIFHLIRFATGIGFQLIRLATQIGFELTSHVGDEILRSDSSCDPVRNCGNSAVAGKKSLANIDDKHRIHAGQRFEFWSPCCPHNGAMSKLLAEVDTRDDRRELWHLLHRLAPGDRVRFLHQSCAQVQGAHRPTPRILRADVERAYRCDRADERLTTICYFDLIALSAQWGISLRALGVQLERRARRCVG